MENSKTRVALLAAGIYALSIGICFAVVNDGTTTLPNLSEQSLPVLNTVLQENNHRLQILEASTADTVWTLFDTSTGHDHDGIDSKKVLFTNLDLSGFSSGFLYSTGSTIVATADTVTSGDTVVASALNSEVTSNGTYTKVKEVYSGASGELRIVFSHRSQSVSTSYAQIYRNDIAVGTERTATNTTWATYTENISGWSRGDRIQLYIKRGTGDPEVKDFYVEINGLQGFTTTLN